jgi:arsenite methyltransferase
VFENRYGIDAPVLVRNFFAVGSVSLLVSGCVVVWFGMHWWAVWLAFLILIGSVYSLGMGSFMFYTSLVSKVRGRESLLGLIDWTGQEEVLDIGCGRGLLLVGAAHRLTTGHVTGIDLWIEKDQSSNKKTAAVKNAQNEGVADRIRVETADMRELPFGDGKFDIVLSSWAVHNLEIASERLRALAEMVRVLRPGGTILLNDIANRHEYQRELVRLGLNNVKIVVESQWRGLLVGLISFGAYRPATIIGQR